MSVFTLMWSYLAQFKVIAEYNGNLNIEALHTYNNLMYCYEYRSKSVTIVDETMIFMSIANKQTKRPVELYCIFFCSIQFAVGFLKIQYIHMEYYKC